VNKKWKNQKHSIAAMIFHWGFVFIFIYGILKQVEDIGPQSPSDNDYVPGFASDLMLKDLRLAQQAAHKVQAVTPMGNAAGDIYESFVEKDNGSGLDFSAILPWIKNINKSQY